MNMLEPPRLSTNDTFASKLVKSAKSEKPKRDGMLRAATVASALALGTCSVSMKTSVVASPRLPAWLAALGGAGIVGMGIVMFAAPEARPTRLEVHRPRTMVMPAVPSSITTAPDTRPEPVPPAKPVATVRPSSVVPPSSAPTTPAPLPSNDDELTMLRRAKRNLKAGEGQAALDELDAHAAAFPRTAFAEEVAALRVEAFATAGDETHARRAAEAFYLRYPESNYTLRVRSAAARAGR